MDQPNHDLTKITDLTAQLGLTSRSLRYYEQIGLIQSIRPAFEKYRFYTAENIERLKQIIVLRKMQIPVKDILRIYENESMSVVVETFVNRISAIDDEIGALAELKRIVGEFLQTMLDNGITKISTLPLLYEEMDKQLVWIDERRSVTYEDLNTASQRLSKPVEPAILSLPAMRTLSSCLQANPQESDLDGFWRWIQAQGIPPGEPGQHDRFELQSEAGDILLLRVPADFANDSGYADATFDGGLFATVNVYLDEDLGERFRTLVTSFDNNLFYEIDYTHKGELRHPAMLENLISPDEKRELVALLVPVKKRIADARLFDKPEELAPDSITLAAIEAQNPVLWAMDVPLDKLTPINNPHYRVLENGEAEYTGWISTRVLNTNIAVKLPFRVDITFRLAGGDEQFGYGDSEGSLIFYHGEDTGYFAGGHLGQMGFGVNMGNHATTDAWTSAPAREEALSFRQPVFRDFFSFPGRGKIKASGYNDVTWIVGAKQLAAVINGEIRYCGINFPYMALDLGREKARAIVIGSNGQGMKYFKSIRISQLAYTPKPKFRKSELVLAVKRSNNLIPHIHRLVTDEYGENYWFNGCAKYVMESLGEKDFDYPFFAGLTGDVFTQYYPYDGFRGEGVSGYRLAESPSTDLRERMTGSDNSESAGGFVEHLFKKCGYASALVNFQDLEKNARLYLQNLITSIDKGVPVITWRHGGPPVGVFVGYEEYGKTLLYITGNNNEPERILLESALAPEPSTGGWIFVGEKKENRDLAQIYREAICALPGLLTTKTDQFCFGAEAFRAWANDIESGRFDGIKPEDFDAWALYTAYVCGLATNGSCCHTFLQRARALNPDMGYLEDVSRLYQRAADMWNNDRGEDLEALGGGFNVTLAVLQDKPRRGKIIAKIRAFADLTDEIVRTLDKNLKEIK